MLDSSYVDQVTLLLELLPEIAPDTRFAIKGGTAINLFLLDFPRLSVDIDLCYLPLTPRDQALFDIEDFIKKLANKFSARGLRTLKKRTSDGYDSTLFVSRKSVKVKIEINLIVRGAVYEPVLQSLAPAASSKFESSMDMLCLHPHDLYGGKLCAALDRQNPRDFFDLYMFMENNNYTRELHETFMVYLLSSNRPIDELLNAREKDMRTAFDTLFSGMTTKMIGYSDLENTRKRVFNLVSNSFTGQDKEFLLSFFSRTPKWNLFPLGKLQQFPSIKWKLHNIQMMNLKKREEALTRLESLLNRIA
jgi:predicted nucleotidyltransferase component of viral defense system